MEILAIGAHPDDIELGCGGTLYKHARNGDSVYILILSNGERSGSVDQRRRESQESSRKLKVKSVFFGDLPDTLIPEHSETIMKIEHIINQVRPNRIYTHNIDDIHQDHRNVAKATISASRKSSGILCYETPKSTVFSPQYFVDISDVIDVKAEAIRCFVSQSNKEYMKINAIKGLASYRGYIVGVKYAEAFSVVRLFDNLP